MADEFSPRLVLFFKFWLGPFVVILGGVKKKLEILAIRDVHEVYDRKSKCSALGLDRMVPNQMCVCVCVSYFFLQLKQHWAV